MNHSIDDTHAPCAVQGAQDYDTRRVYFNGKLIEEGVYSDGPLTYKWSASMGHFKNSAEGQSVTWIAPHVAQETRVTIRCTIDDPPGPRVGGGETGSHDDAPTVREAIVVVKPFHVEFSGPELVNQTVRACAGGIDDHAATDPNPNWVQRNDAQYRAHTRQVELTAKSGNNPLPYARFSLRFVGNKGHDYGDRRAKKTAKLHKADAPFATDVGWEDTLDLQADGAGHVSVWVLSSDVINEPTLQAIVEPVPPPREPVELGRIECDFAASETFRNFKNPVAPDDPDDYGWIFDFPKLINPNAPAGQVLNTPVKVYLKFRIDPNKEEDMGNWQFVNGHDLLLSVVRITTVDFKTGESRQVEGTPGELSRYAYFANSIGPAGTAIVNRTTKSQGETAPQPYVVAGPDIKASFTVFVQAEDKTEHKG